MPDWTVKRTETFLKYLKKHKSHHALINELDKKIKQLKKDPDAIGGYLAIKNERKIFI